MYTKNKIILALLLISITTHYIFSVENFKYKTLKGMSVDINKNDNLPYIVTKLEINIPDCKYNPYLPYLNLIFMFNDYLNNKDNSILSNLKKIGNDYKLSVYPDKIIIKNIFLKRNINHYIDLLYSLFNYNSFSTSKLKKIKDNFNFYLKTMFDFGKLFIQNKIFKLVFTKNSKFANTITDFTTIPDINIAFLKSFNKKTFRLRNSKLTIYGDINPYIFFGKIKNKFKNFKKENPLEPNICKNTTKIIDKNRIHFINRKEIDSPVLYTILILNSDDLITINSMKIINQIIFGMPSGRLFKDSAKLNIHNLKITTSEILRNDFFMIINKIETNKEYINKIIKITNLEFKYILINKITRKEYLESINFFYGNYLIKKNNPFSEYFFIKNFKQSFVIKSQTRKRRENIIYHINNVSKKILNSKSNSFSKILIIESSSYFSLSAINNDLKLINLF